MSHRSGGPTTGGLSQREKEILLALSRTIVPGNRIVPRANPETVAQVEEFLSQIPPFMQRGFAGVLWMLEMHTIARYGSRFTRLPYPKRLEALRRWVNGSAIDRNVIRLVTATVKIAHFHRQSIYRSYGCSMTFETPVKEERERWQDLILDGVEVTGDEELECDVVVVGTGAGGAAVAKALAEAGLAVVMIEEGKHYTRKDFTGDVIQMQRLMYRDLGGIMAVGNVPVLIPIGKAVGGTTVINSGTAKRPPDRVLNEWERELGLPELGPEALGPYVDRVWEFLEVGPTEDKYLGDVARVIGRGCEVLGYKHGPLQRNAPGCDGQARCAFGCPTDAKKSTNVSYVPAALKANAFLYTSTVAEKVLMESGRAVGIQAKTEGGATITVRSRATVLACGALLTPVFLMRQGLCKSSGQLGKNLSIHPAIGSAGEMDSPTDGYLTVPQGYGIEGLEKEGLLFEGATGPPDLTAGATHDIGPEFMDFCEIMDRLVVFGFAVKDESRGQVFQGPWGKPLITYYLNDHDLAQMKKGVEILCRIFFAAGARRVHFATRDFGVFAGEDDIRKFRNANVKARDFDISAYHPLGTTRMGSDPRRSVVGSDHRCHDVPGLYICDGGALPSSLGVNPQITIMAMATRAGELLADELEG